jgi:Uncharacterized conserved protein
MQKLMFLFTVMQENPVYYFFPYKYGCYSFQLNKDLKTLCNYNLIEEKNEGWYLNFQNDISYTLYPEDQSLLEKHLQNFGELKGKSLIRYVYKNYPYFAIKSEIAKDYLSKQDWKKVIEAKPQKFNFTLFTIGYEAKTLDQYLNKLIQEDIKVLFDVRKNPISRKFGFSKNQLKWGVEAIGIEYIHLPELGIESNQRKSLISLEDYQKLFDKYKKTTLLASTKDQDLIINVLNEKKRVALTCFEANPNFCHRLSLAESILEKYEKNLFLEHL